MSKHLTPGRVVRYLLLLTVACAVVLGVTFARYATVVQGQGSGDVAAVSLGLTGDSAADLTSQLQGMKPGDTRELKFAVTNADSETTSEVTQAYSVSIVTTGNLPLEFSLDSTGVSKGTSATVKSNLIWLGGELPYGSDVKHDYTLTVTWPKDASDSALAYEIDWVVLKVDAQQAKPTEVL